MFLRTRVSALRDRKRGKERKSIFSTSDRKRERERSESVEYVLFFLSIIDLFFFPFVLEHTKNAQKKQISTR